jgi:renalase
MTTALTSAASITSSIDKPIAVIGAGIAGLSCAQALQRQGHQVVVYDKARGVSGRVSTRRSELGGFDHGAQYFTVRDAVFQSQVNQWCEEGVVAPWHGKIAAWNCDASGAASGGVFTPSGTANNSPCVRYVGVGGMSVIGKRLAQDVMVHTAHRLMALVPPSVSSHDHWQLQFDNGMTHIAAHVILAIPPEQAADVLRPLAMTDAVFDRLYQRITAIKSQPVWAVMLAFDAPVPCEWDGVFVNKGALSWMARDSSKLQRAAGERWVLHATPAWTQAHLDALPEVVAQKLLAELQRIVAKPLPTILHQAAHRWLYARHDGDRGDHGHHEFTDGFYHDEVHQLSIIGDWLYGGRVEGAWCSGVNLARHLYRALD